MGVGWKSINQSVHDSRTIGISYYSYEFDAMFRLVGNRFGVRRARAGDSAQLATSLTGFAISHIGLATSRLRLAIFLIGLSIFRVGLAVTYYVHLQYFYLVFLSLHIIFY